jgi:hypothetical protein
VRIFLILALFGQFSASYARELNLCVWDVIGHGSAYDTMQDYALAAKSWGVNLQVNAYTDEGAAFRDFKSGQCDAVFLSGRRARMLNAFSGSLDAVGAIQDYSQLRDVISLLADPRLAKRLTLNGLEFAGAAPLGAVYTFLTDRKMNKLAKLEGRKVAVFDWDPIQNEIVQKIGAKPTPVNLNNFGAIFNRREVDLIFAPIYAYKSLELYKGLGAEGGIARFPVTQFTLQLIFHKYQFPEGIAQKSREYMAQQTARFLRNIRNAENEVAPKYWMNVPLADREEYEAVMRDLRVQLTKEGFYDPRMMTLLKRVRCKYNPVAQECSLALEKT